MNDWRLTNHQDYLKGLTLWRRAYHPAAETNDHDHCELCFAKFMEGGAPDTLQEGYSTEDSYRWICPSCFNDLSVEFGWTVAASSNSSFDTDATRRST